MRRLDELHLEFLSPEIACCAVWWLPRDARWAVGM